ncbi:MAG: phosphoribosylformylglycinamidine cyclo-ligase [Candidatus Izimaplasma sp.]|nr:phosphoribosylformylglycinamidine cyclo-ligase [Candidatus Izimaplasma bacterium]
MSKHYKESGVNLAKGQETISRIQQHTNINTDFAGLFDISGFDMSHPLLVSGTDGVGTKLLIANKANKHDTIGIDLVAMCVNDILTLGAKPLFFLDYFATSQLDPAQAEEVIKGIVEGCEQSDMQLIGGETAEMPGLYQNNDYDLAGFTTGIVDKANLIDKQTVKAGNLIIGLESSGIHSNGYSLVRKILFEDQQLSLDKIYAPLNVPLKEELLKPTKIYVKPVLNLLKTVNVKSMAHITGGGFYENIPRALPSNLGVRIKTDNLPKLPIFELLQTQGNIPTDELYHVFNMGIGFVLIIDAKDKVETLTLLEDYSPQIIGTVTTQKGVIFQ